MPGRSGERERFSGETNEPLNQFRRRAVTDPWGVDKQATPVRARLSLCATRSMRVKKLRALAWSALLSVAAAAPLVGLGGDDTSAPLLLACGSDGQKSTDINELIAALTVAHGVCCDQLGEACDGDSDYSLPSAANGATTCTSPVCARAIQLVADSCAPLLGSASFAIFATPFQGIIDGATQACAAAPSPQRFVITDGASSKDVDVLSAAPAVLTDGMGAGGHGGSVAGQDTATLLQVAAGGAVLLILEMLWLAPRDLLMVSVDGAAVTMLQGHDLPSEGERTFRSKPGGAIRVTMVQDPAKVAGAASLFSFAIPCVADTACGGHGSCDNGRCVCTGMYTGSGCEDDPPCLGVDCGAHGSCNTADGTCTCAAGYHGEKCSVRDSFVISGATCSSCNGRYTETAYVCNGKPVYQTGGSGGPVLFRPSGQLFWEVGTSDKATSCEYSGGNLRSSGSGGACPGCCPDSPDGAGCAGQWWELYGSWHNNPSVAVVASQGR